MNVPNVRRANHPVESETVATLCQGLHLAPGIATISRRAVLVMRALKDKIMADVIPLNSRATINAVVLAKVVGTTYERLTFSIGLKERNSDEPIKLEGDLAWILGRDGIGELLAGDEDGENLVRMTKLHQIVVSGIKELEKGFTIGLTLEVRHTTNSQVG